MVARRFLLAALLGTVAALGSGCITATAGTCGRLAFTIQGDDDFLPSAAGKGRIARGSKVDVTVFRIDTGGILARPATEPNWSGPPEKVKLFGDEKVPLTRVTSTDEHVVAVSETKGSVVTLEGRAPGVAEVVFSTANSSDSFDFTVAEVHRVSLDHLAGRLLLASRFPAQAAFLAGGTARFQMTRYTDDGSELQGFGIEAPVEIDPPEMATLAGQARDSHHLGVKFNAAGTVKLKPKNGKMLQLVVVEAASVASLDLGASDEKDSSLLKVGGGTLLFLRAALADGTPVLGTEGAAEVASQTPDTCRIQSDSRFFGDGFYSVGAWAPGPCKITVKLGQLSAETSLTVGPK